MRQLDKGLSSFDHVVVLMMENRSFDHILGYLYDGDVPAGKTFAGAQGYSNPDHSNSERIYTSPSAGNYDPYPDPGETYEFVIEQLYGVKPGERGPGSKITMQGFVKSYYDLLKLMTERPAPFRWPGDPAWQSRAIMKCFEPTALPVLRALARDFAVFDHWFCAVPSETWPNRAFWNADTSWGWADNPMSADEWNLLDWFARSETGTLFTRLDEKFGSVDGNWRIYSDLPLALTKIVHWRNLFWKSGAKYSRPLTLNELDIPNFLEDCACGHLPKYAFLEPMFVNDTSRKLWHNDMHPSEWPKDYGVLPSMGPASIQLGDELIRQVYEAVRTSPNRDRTLLIITFDEHGGCFDHVPPPPTVSPNKNEFQDPRGQFGFQFDLLGPRVPMVMISSHIAPKTIVNTPLDHSSFLQTMQQKWGFKSLGPRMDQARGFADGLFTLDKPRSWPSLALHSGTASKPDERVGPPLDDRPVNGLQASIFNAMLTLFRLHGSDTPELPKTVVTTREAQAVLDRAWELRRLDRRS